MLLQRLELVCLTHNSHSNHACTKCRVPLQSLQCRTPPNAQTNRKHLLDLPASKGHHLTNPTATRLSVPHGSTYGNLGISTGKSTYGISRFGIGIRSWKGRQSVSPSLAVTSVWGSLKYGNWFQIVTCPSRGGSIFGRFIPTIVVVLVMMGGKVSSIIKLSTTEGRTRDSILTPIVFPRRKRRPTIFIVVTIHLLPICSLISHRADSLHETLSRLCF